MTLSRRSLTILTVALGYGVGFWMVLLHHLEGAHEQRELPLVLHWLRDSTLSLPAIAAAVWLAAGFVRGILANRSEAAVPARLRTGLFVTTVGFFSSAALGLGGPVHEWLFGAREAVGRGLIDHVSRDSTTALVVALPIAWLLAGLVLPRAGPARLARRAGARALSFAAAGITLILVGLVTVSAGGVSASVGPGSPCPDGAPLKRFSVDAIDVDIPLNRFGDHYLGKMYALEQNVNAVRAQEASRQVSVGLRDDAIQPLVIRANQGDCVEIDFDNDATGGAYGVHIDGLAFDVGSSGDQVGQNASSAVSAGGGTLYRYWIPIDKTLEGAHYLHPGPGNREAISLGLFGSLIVEPPGSRYLHPRTLAPIDWGWEAIIDPGTGADFRETAQLFHEVGNEDFKRILNADGVALPVVDPHTDAYRPGARALNYRSEPFMNRLDAAEDQKSQAYGSYTFADPPTPTPQGYLGDPTKFRILHAGSELFHVYHLHGGGIRWRFNPHADPTYDYADTGLNKHPVEQSGSTRLDSQAFGPGESYDLQMEGGAGGVQQAVGDFLFHCHIAEHYVAGMWAFWRVFNTLQPDLAPLPDRAPPATAVDSAGLIGRTMADGTTLTAANLDDWIRPQLPPQGVPRSRQDAAVWNWTVDSSTPGTPVYLGEPETAATSPNLVARVPGHPGSYPGDEFVGNRPKIRFNPQNGRISYPLLRPHIGRRPPFSPNGHSGAPYLGTQGDVAPGPGVSAWANRPDGVCPAGSTLRRFNVVALSEVPVQVTRAGGPNGTDARGKLFVLAKNKDGVRDGTKPREPLAIRANSGDCVGLTLTSEQVNDADNPYAKVNIHIHHVQFDPQGSDGVISGMSYEQSIRPYKLEDTTLNVAAAAGATTLTLASIAKFQPGVWIGVGLGTEEIEVRQIASIDAAARTVTLTQPLSSAHAGGEWAGVEFTQYRWYPDVAMDNVFFHDHVDGIHGWSHGLVGQLVVEPRGSTYHDPQTGAEVDSGTIVDIRTSNPLAPGLVEGSFRELVLWTINSDRDMPLPAHSTLNLRAEPWAGRLTANPDPSLTLSSYTHGDPFTPLPRAYPGDSVVIRALSTGPTMDSLHVDGHKFFLENRYLDANGVVESSPQDTLHYGVSERFTLMLQGGAGGPAKVPGDYLYMNGLGERFRDGAWGLLRVLPGQVSDLQPLPGTNPPVGSPLPAVTGGRPPAAAGPGNPCPAGAPARSFDVTAVNVPHGGKGATMAFVPSAQAAAVGTGTFLPEPLVLHAAAGDCVTVSFTNRANARASFHVGELERTIESSGVNVGFNPEQTVAFGQSRTYRYFAASERVGSALISDFGGNPAVLDSEPEHAGEFVPPETGREGLYGAIVIAPAGATFAHPLSGVSMDVGSAVDVNVPGRPSYRDFTVLFSERDARIGGNFMPYHTEVQGPALVNYRSAPTTLNDTGAAFAVTAATPILRAYRGDPMTVHALVAPGSEQVHVFGLGGLAWPLDPVLHYSSTVTARGVGAWGSVDAEIAGGAGGWAKTVGDFYYGMQARPFTQAGMWGLVRVLADSSCPIRPLPGRTCLGGVAPSAPPAPTFSGTAPPSPGTSLTPKLLGSAQADTTVRIYRDAACTLLVATGSAGEFGSSGIAVTVAPSSTTNFRATATSAEGGPSICSAPITYVHEASTTPAPPSKPDLTPGSDTGVSSSDDITRKTTPVFKGTALAGSTVELLVDGAVKGSAVAASNGVWQITASAIDPGVHAVTATARNAAGVTSLPSAALQVTIDTAVPTVTVAKITSALFSPNGDGKLDTTTATATFSETVAFTFEITNQAQTSVLHSAAGQGAAMSQVWDGRSAGVVVADGAYKWRIRGTDVAGNTLATYVRPVTVDTTGPTLSGLSATPNPFTPAGGGQTAISMNVSEAADIVVTIRQNGVLVRKFATVKLTAAGVAGVNWDGKRDNGTTVTAGVYRILVTATDLGQVAGVQQALNVTVAP